MGEEEVVTRRQGSARGGAGRAVLFTLATAVWLGLSLSARASEVEIPGLFNTGVDAQGTVLPVGSPELHHSLAGPVSPAFVINPHPHWVAPPPDAAWIGPSDGVFSDPVGTYVYTIAFDLAGLDPSTARITGKLAADNGPSILLNGVDIGFTHSGQFGYLKEFNVDTGFIEGVNTMEVWVVNEPCVGCLNPTGLLVADFTGWAQLPSIDVAMGDNGIPMQGVFVYAVDPVSHNVVANLGKTDPTGSVFVTGAPQGEWILQAEIFYTEPATNLPTTIRNYPDNDPTRAYDLYGSIDIPPIIFPAPVLMQGGLLGGQGTFGEMRQYLEADPLGHSDKEWRHLPAFLCFPMPNIWQDPWGYDNTAGSVRNHDWNAARLWRWADEKVEGVLATWIDQMQLEQVEFDVVCHSMGGLITRALATGQHSNRMGRIASLDGVHGGTRIARTTYFSALHEGWLNGFSILPYAAPVIPGWNAGHADPNHRERWLLYACAPDPIVTPDASAWGVGESTILGTPFPSGWSDDWVEGYDLASGDSHGSIHKNMTRQRECALFLTKRLFPSGSLAGRGTTTPIQPPGRVALRVTATAGSSSGEVVAFDANALVKGSAVVQGASAQYLLKDAGGTPIPLENLQSQALSSDALFESFELTLPPAGDITVELTANPSSDAVLDLALDFDSHRYLVSSFTPEAVSSGQSIQFLSEVDDASGLPIVGTGTLFESTISLPDGSNQILQLFDDGLHGDGTPGDGVFGNTFAGTTLEGRYAVDTVGQLDLGGETIRRSELGEFVVNATGAAFAGAMVETTPDLNGNSLFDSLNFQQDLLVAADGSYKLVAVLEDTLGNAIMHLSDTVGGALAGSQIALELVVPAEEIVRHGVDGPWILKSPTLYDLDRGALPCDSSPDHITQPYTISQFESPEPPTINLLLPSVGPPEGGNTVVIYGTSLNDATGVWIGGQVAEIVGKDSDFVTVTVPRNTLMRSLPAGTTGSRYPIPATVRVATPWGEAVVVEGYTYRDDL